MVKNTTRTHGNSNIKKVAIIVLAVVMVLSMIGTGLVLKYIPDQYPTSTTTASTTATVDQSQNIQQVNSMENSILLVDKSGSTASTTIAGSNYESIVPFSSGIGVSGGYSEIAEAINEELQNGYSRIGVITDCEESHQDGNTSWAALNGHYSNVEIKVYLTENFDDSDVQNAIAAISAVIDHSNCTFIVYEADGSIYRVICDNFDFEDTLDQEENIPVVVETSYETTSTAGNSIPLSLVIILVEVFFLIFCIMAILLLALAGNNAVEVEEPIEVAIKESQNVICDLSGSMQNCVQDVLSYCRNLGKTTGFTVIAERVLTNATLSDLEAMPASGKTPGYEAMKTVFNTGVKVVTIVTDGGFNDDPAKADGVMFDKIFFVGKGLSENNVQHLTKYSKEYEVIAL